MNYELIDANPEDEQWVNRLTIDTMRPYVEASWPGETERRHYYDLNKFNLQNTKIVFADGKKAGRLTFSIKDGVFDLADLHILPDFQGSGLGTRIIKDKLRQAADDGLAMELKCLKTNPVQNLYIRLGFKLILEDEKRLYYRFDAPEGN